MSIKVLHITPDFNYSCGVSKYVHSLLHLFNNDKEYEMHFITNGGNSLVSLDNLNVKVSIMKFEKGIKNILHYRNNIKYLKKYCTEHKIDIIHSHHRYPEFLANKIKQQVNIKTITTAHSIVNKYKRISFKSDKIIAVSNSVKSNIVDNYNVDENKVVVLYNFPFIENDKKVDIKELKNSLSIPEENKVIMFVGRMKKIKGVDILIRVFNKMKHKNKISLVLVGGSMEKDIKKLLNSDKEGLIYLGEQKDVSSYYHLADVVVLPSIEEPLGYTMLEAGYTGKPFIGANIGGISEFIKHEENGLLFNCGNENDLYKKLQALIEDNILSQKIANNLKQKINDGASEEKYYSKLTSLYKEILNA